MVHTIFLRYLNISVTTGIVIGILLLLSPFFRKRYTARWKYWVWLLLAIRLIVPVTMPESKVAIVLPVLSAESAVNEGTNLQTVSGIAEGFTGAPDAYITQGRQLGDKGKSQYAEDVSKADNAFLFLLSEITLRDVVILIWLSGIAIFGLYHLIGHMVFRKNMLRRAHKPQRERIYSMTKEISEELGLQKEIRIEICKNVVSPMMLGVMRPVLVLPKEDYSEEELRFVLSHELYHCKRKDLWYKLALLAANGIHWFNPIVWLMCREANGDLERTCDDAVLRSASYEDRKAYTQTILAGIAEQVVRENNLSTYFYGGKKELKNRFTNILDRRKRRSGKWLLLSVAVCVLLVGGVVACGYQEDAEKNDGITTDENVTAPTDELQEALSENLAEPENATEHVNVTDSAETTEHVDKIDDMEATGVIKDSEEEVFEELQTESASYQATQTGIYRVTDAGKECIYDGYPGLEPRMCIFENRLYFKTDVTYKEGALDWADCGIKWIDLQTLENDILNIDLNINQMVTDFYVYNGLISVTVNAYGTDYEKIFLLPVENREVYNGKAVEELTDREKQEYGREISRWLTDNPCTLVDVSNRTAAENFALIDLNMDGTVEQITLRPLGNETTAYSPLDYYELSLNGKVIAEDYASNLNNNIWAISLDGKEILMVLYEDGPSADPYTRLFRYANGSLVEAGSFAADIRECEITKECIIRGVIRRDVIETSFCYVSWQMNNQHMLEEVPQEIYDFVWIHEVQLLEELTLHTEPDGEETFVISPQTVSFLQVTSDEHWILLETLDGVRGWFEVDNFEIVESGKESREMFEGLSFFG